MRVLSPSAMAPGNQVPMSCVFEQIASSLRLSGVLGAIGRLRSIDPFHIHPPCDVAVVAIPCMLASVGQETGHSGPLAHDQTGRVGTAWATLSLAGHS
jgi:hypothetical protein